MVGIASALISAAGAAARIRRAVSAARQARDAAGGVATAVRAAKAEVSGQRESAAREIGAAIDGLRREIADLRAGAGKRANRAELIGQAEAGLLAALQCRANVTTQAIYAEAELDCLAVESESAAEIACLRIADSADGPAALPPDGDLFRGEETAPAMLEQGAQHAFPHESIRSHGCYFLCLAAWAERIRGRGFGTARIIEMYGEMAREGLVLDDDHWTAFVKQPVAVLNRLVGRAEFSGMSPDRVSQPAEPVYVQKVRNGKWPHFVLCLPGGEKWDSLGANAARYVHEGFRVFLR